MLQYLGSGGHDDHLMRRFSSQKGFYDSQWVLTGCYFKHCDSVFVSFLFFFLLVFPFLSASLLKNTAFLVFALFDSLFSFNLGCKSQRQVQWPLGAFQHKLKLFDIQNCAIRNNMTFSKLSAIWELSFILRYDKCSISIKGGVSLV